MVKINGIELRALRTETTEDKVSLQLGSFYLEGKKIASFQTEKEGQEGETFTQLFMMRGYSEDALCAQLEAAGMDLEGLLTRFRWLNEMQKQYNDHKATASGVVSLQHEYSTVTMGIPARLAGADEEQVLAELQHFIEKNEKQYGTCTGYVMFRSEEDFCQGEAIPLEALKA